MENTKHCCTSWKYNSPFAFIVNRTCNVSQAIKTPRLTRHEIFKLIICHTLPPINHWFISLFVTTVSFINTFCPSCANTDASSLFPLSSAQIHNSPAAFARCCGCDCHEDVMDCNLPQLHKVTIPPGLLRSRDKCVLHDFWIEDVRHWIPPQVSFITLKWLTMLVV